MRACPCENRQNGNRIGTSTTQIIITSTVNGTPILTKSLKLYFHAFRNEGIFFEAATNKICDDLGAALKPRSLTIIAKWKARGGFSSVITADWVPAKKRRR